MKKVLRMLVRIKRLRKQIMREEFFRNREYNHVYSVMIIDHNTRSMQRFEFQELKDAVSYIYTKCDTCKTKEFFVHANTSKGTKFLQLNPQLA